MTQIILTEKSSVPNDIKQAEGGQEIVSRLHQYYDIPHDAEFKEISKISWASLANRGVVLFVGTKGVAALVEKSGQYTVISIEDGDIAETGFTRGGTPSKPDRTDYALYLVKEEVGKIRKMFYAEPDVLARNALSAKRKQDATASSDKNVYTIEDLQVRFSNKIRPLIAKIAQQQVASYLGLSNTRAKAGEFDLAIAAMKAAKTLSEIENSPVALHKAITSAAILTYVYQNPDAAQYVQRSYEGVRYFSVTPPGYSDLLRRLVKQEDLQEFSIFFKYFKKVLR